MKLQFSEKENIIYSAQEVTLNFEIQNTSWHFFCCETAVFQWQSVNINSFPESYLYNFFNYRHKSAI